MIDPRTLRKILRRALHASLVSSAACGSFPPKSDFTPPNCTRNIPSIAGITPNRPVDYAELRATHHVGVGGREETEVISMNGTLCGGATDMDACRNAFAALAPTTGFLDQCPVPSPECTRYTIATTTANDVSAVTTKAALLGFLSPVDTAQEALLLGWVEGYAVCGDDAFGTRTFDDAIEVTGLTGGCSTDYRRVLLIVSADGSVATGESQVITPGDPKCVIGRRHAGMRAASIRPAHRRAGTSVVGDYLSSAAQLEAASVDAFLDLGVSLEGLGAPSRLIAASSRAADDEVRHARITGRLAQRYGSAPHRPAIDARTAASLEALAIDNAVEGCVRETFGALCGAHQATHAADPVVRSTLSEITTDEIRHAALAWQIAGWAEPRLDRAAQRRVRDARHAAVATLRAELATAPDPSITLALGVPTAEGAIALIDALSGDLLRAVA